MEDFIAKLSCHGDTSMKVVSIFGNTGDGKSHTLNHVFFCGKEVFGTSPSQLSCTVGVWAAYDEGDRVIVLDTEGLLGMSGNHNQRTRLLLKVLAISDIVIYRTRAERLHTDTFTFLGDASDAYLKHFTKELKDATERCHMDVPLCSLGPAVIIFHETQHTHLLGVSQNESNPSGLEKFCNLLINYTVIPLTNKCLGIYLKFWPKGGVLDGSRALDKEGGRVFTTLLNRFCFMCSRS